MIMIIVSPKRALRIMHTVNIVSQEGRNERKKEGRKDVRAVRV